MRTWRAALAALACAWAAWAPAQQKARDAGPPQVAVVKSFAGAADLGLTKGLSDKLQDLAFGAAEARLVRPSAVLAGAGALYVADPGAKGVHRFDLAARRYALIGAADGAPLAQPLALAQGPDGAVYVADAARRAVLVIRAGSDAAEPLRLGASLGRPGGIAYDAGSGRLYVVDSAVHCVAVFGRDGKLETIIGRPGSGRGEFRTPTRLWRDRQGRLYVSDEGNARVQVFDAAGKFVLAVHPQGDGSQDAARLTGVASDSRGRIYVANGLFHAVQVFDAAGNYLLSIGGRGGARGEFQRPYGLFVGDDDALYVADAGNGRIQVLRLKD